MSTVLSEESSMEKCSVRLVDPKECTTTKNGLINGLVYNKKNNSSCNGDEMEIPENIISDIKELKDSITQLQNHKESLQQDVVSNDVRKEVKKGSRKKKRKARANETVNGSDIEHQRTESNRSSNIDILPSCSKSSNGEFVTCDTILSDIKQLVINDDSTLTQTEETRQKIDFVPYESELQMPMIMKIIQKDLSEPYSIYTYRYFIHNWPKLCFLAMCEDQCVGAIVCKLDLHRKVVRRGYIAMLAVDQNYRKLRIGSTLVQMAIQEMTNGDADEVVLETEVTNKPALKLYEKLGFVRDKRLFRYYLNGVDALRLKLWLR